MRYLTYFIGSRNRNSMKDRYQSGEDRRSHSLDGDGEPSKAILEHQKLLIHLDKNKNRSTWNKVKMIVANRTSRKSVKSTGSNNSRDVSPIENLEYLRDRADSLTSSPSYAGAYNLNIPDYDYCLHNQLSSDDNESKSFECRQGKPYRGSKKQKHIPDIESLPEGVPFEPAFKQKSIPKPLNLQQVREKNIA
jgi:serine/arginine repetitive matrix protein 2